MGLNSDSLFGFVKKLLIILNITAFSFMFAVILNSYIALNVFKVNEKIEIKKEKQIVKKEKQYDNIKNLFLPIEEKNITIQTQINADKKVIINKLNDISLIGTFLFDKERIALIKYKNKTVAIKQGQFFEGYKVSRINKNIVYLEKNGKVYQVVPDISTKFKAKSNSIKKITTDTQSDRSFIKLSKSVVERETADIGNLLKDVRLIPIVKNGETVGFKFTYINPRSLLYKYGLRSGDLIKSVNGMPVRTAEEAFKIYNMLRNESRIEIEIDRNGKRKVIVYEIQ